MDLNIINISELESQYQELIHEHQNLKNEIVSPFLQSYFYRCENIHVKKMASKFQNKLNDIEKSYKALANWLDAYIMSAKGVENAISQNKTSGITEGAILEFALHHFAELKPKTIELQNSLNPSSLGSVKNDNPNPNKKTSSTVTDSKSAENHSDSVADFESGFTMEGYQFDYQKMLDELGKFNMDFKLNFDFDNLKELDLQLKDGLENLTNSKIDIGKISSNIVDKINISSWNTPELNIEIVKGNMASISGLISGLLNIGILKMPGWVNKDQYGPSPNEKLDRILSLSHLNLADIKKYFSKENNNINHTLAFMSKDYLNNNKLNNSFALSTSSKIGGSQSAFPTWYEFQTKEIGKTSEISDFNINLNQSFPQEEFNHLDLNDNQQLKVMTQSGIGTSLLLGGFMALSGKMLGNNENSAVKNSPNQLFQNKTIVTSQEKFTSLIRTPLIIGNNYTEGSFVHKKGFCFFDYQKAMELLTQNSKISTQKAVYIYPQ